MSLDKGFQVEVSKTVIRQAKRGDIAAFEHIYLVYADACYSLANRICGQSSMAEDIVQESFIKMMQKIKHYRAEGLFAGWLSRIVTHETIDRIKGNSKVHWLGEDNLEFEESNDLFSYNWLEACSDLDNLISHLSATARAVFLLHEVEGLSHKEIATLFDKTESFSKVTLSRAYATLKSVASAIQQENQDAFK